MLKRQSLWVALMVGALTLLGGCGDQASSVTDANAATDLTTPETVQAPSDVASLVPVDSDLLLYIPSVDDLQAKVRRVVGAVDPQMVKEVDVDMMLSQFAGPLLDLLDRSKPIAIAMKLHPEAGPVPTMVLPVQDMDAAKKRITDGGQPEPKSSGSYLQMMAMPGEPPAGGSKLATDIPEGDLVIRVNLAGLIAQNREMIDGMLEEMEQGSGNMPVPGMDKMMEGMQQVMADVLTSAEGFDLTVGVEGTNVHLKGYFTAKEGSALASPITPSAGLAPLAGALPGDYPFAMLLSMDTTKVMEWMKPFMELGYEMYPENVRDSLKAYMDAWMPLYEKMGDKHAFAMDINDKGMAMVGVSTMKDAKGFIEDYKRIATDKGGEFAKDMGVAFRFGQGKAVAGQEVHTIHLSFDWEKIMKVSGQDEQLPPEAAKMAQDVLNKLFGGNDITMSMVPLGDRLAWTMGGDDALIEKTIKAAQGGKAQGGIANAIQTAGGAPTFLLYLEGRSFVNGILGMAKNIAPEEARAEIPTAKDGKPVPMVVYGAVNGRKYMGGMSIDIGAVMEMVQEFMK